MKHSCALASGAYADPAVRIQQWVSAFGSNGLLLPICADTMEPQLQTIAQRIGQGAGALCVTGPFPFSYGSSQPDCRTVDGMNGDVGQLIPNCIDNGDVAPCWTVSDDPVCPGGSKLLNIERGMTMPPARANGAVAFTCDPCPANKLELGCPSFPHRAPDAGALP